MLYKTKIKNGPIWTEVEIVTDEKVPTLYGFEQELYRRFGEIEHKEVYYRDKKNLLHFIKMK